MANSKEEANSNKEEDRMYFQVLIDDIRYSKQQQWNTIYLALVAIGAILGIFLAVESKVNFLCQPLPIVKITPRWFLTVICSFIAGLGIMYIGRYYRDIGNYRYKSRRILREKFSEYTRNIAREDPDAKKDPEWYKQQRREFWLFFIPFLILIFVATVLVICVIMGI